MHDHEHLLGGVVERIRRGAEAAQAAPDEREVLRVNRIEIPNLGRRAAASVGAASRTAMPITTAAASVTSVQLFPVSERVLAAPEPTFVARRSVQSSPSCVILIAKLRPATSASGLPTMLSTWSLTAEERSQSGGADQGSSAAAAGCATPDAATTTAPAQRHQRRRPDPERTAREPTTSSAVRVRGSRAGAARGPRRSPDRTRSHRRLVSRRGRSPRAQAFFGRAEACRASSRR
jgi:hypothetical protein